MSWTPPSDPVTSTVITVAYAVANLLTQIRWLRLMTGNADPPGSSYVVVSDSVSATTWRKVPSDAIADGAITDAKLQNQKLNVAGGTMTGPLGTTAVRFTGASQPWWAIPVGSSLFLGIENLMNALELAPTQVKITAISGAFVNGAEIITTANDDAICNAAQIGGRVPTATPAANAIPIANASGKLDAWITSGSTDAVSVGGRVPTATPTANAIPIANASGKLDAWITPGATGAYVPSGLIALWAASDAVPDAGWVFDTSFQNRFVVGAGGTYARNATGGSVSHAHAGGGHSHTSSLLGVGGTIDAASGSGNQANVVTPNPASATQAHTHTHSLDVTGSTDAAGIATDTIGHLPLYIAVHYIRKI